MIDEGAGCTIIEDAIAKLYKNCLTSRGRKSPVGESGEIDDWLMQIDNQDIFENLCEREPQELVTLILCNKDFMKPRNVSESYTILLEEKPLIGTKLLESFQKELLHIKETSSSLQNTTKISSNTCISSTTVTTITVTADVQSCMDYLLSPDLDDSGYGQQTSQKTMLKISQLTCVHSRENIQFNIGRSS